MAARARATVAASQNPAGPRGGPNGDVIEADPVAAPESDAPQGEAVDDHRPERALVAAQHEHRDALTGVEQVKHRRQAEQGKRHHGDVPIVRVQGDDRLARQPEGGRGHDRDCHRDSKATQCRTSRDLRISRAQRLRHQHARRDAERQRHHEEDRDQVGDDLVPGDRHRAETGNQHRHERERRDFEHRRQSDRHAELQLLPDAGPARSVHLGTAEARVEGIEAPDSEGHGEHEPGQQRRRDPGPGPAEGGNRPHAMHEHQVQGNLQRRVP